MGTTGWWKETNDIKANDYNLNIPRYIDTSEEEEEINLYELTAKMKETDKLLSEGNKELLSMLGDLAFSDQDTEDAVNEFISILKEA